MVVMKTLVTSEKKKRSPHRQHEDLSDNEISLLLHNKQKIISHCEILFTYPVNY